MEKVYKGNGFTVTENEGKHEISWPQGPFDVLVSYPISKENMEKAFRSSRDAYEVMIFAETGQWPLKEGDELENSRAFIRACPELLIKVPENQKLFPEEELKILLIQARRDLDES